jgi:hypothetical protein
MAEKKTVVCGIYQNNAQAEQITPDLLAAGFTRDAISSEHDNAGTRLSVHCVTSEQDTQAKDLLKQTGAQDISSSDEKVDEVFVES